MTELERFREMLTERCEYHRDTKSSTFWNASTMNGALVRAEGIEGADADRIIVALGRKLLTAEQAVEVTLGRRTCRADETAMYEATVHEMDCTACGRTYEHVNGEYEFCPRCGRKVDR